jgi:hypothetical protein
MALAKMTYTPEIVAVVDGCAPENLPAPTVRAHFGMGGAEVTSDPAAELERALGELAERAARSIEIWIDGRLAYEVAIEPHEGGDG